AYVKSLPSTLLHSSNVFHPTFIIKAIPMCKLLFSFPPPLTFSFYFLFTLFNFLLFPFSVAMLQRHHQALNHHSLQETQPVHFRYLFRVENISLAGSPLQRVPPDTAP